MSSPISNTFLEVLGFKVYFDHKYESGFDLEVICNEADKGTTREMGDISRFSLAEEEKELFLEQINQMIQLAEKLQEVRNTEGVLSQQSWECRLPIACVKISGDHLLQGRKCWLAGIMNKDGMFRVPAIFEE